MDEPQVPGHGTARVGIPASLGTRRPTLGVLAGWPVFDAESLNPFLGAVLAGFAAAAVHHDCNLLVAAGTGDFEFDAEVRAAAWPFAGPEGQFAPVGHFNTDALMIVPPVRTVAAHRYMTDLRSAGFPVTFLGMTPGASFVAIDNRDGVRAGLQHLLWHGHERIAFVAGEPADRGDSLSRLRAFREAARESGLDVDERLVAYGMHTRQGGSAAAARILGRGVAFTALMASNDQSAIGAMDLLGRERLHVPHDVAVIGFDDQPSAAAHVPSLTSLAYPLKAAAEALLAMTLRRVRAPNAVCEQVTVEPKLITRLSCGCVPGASALGAADPSPTPRSADRLLLDVLRRLRAEDGGRWQGPEPEAVVRAAIEAFLRVLSSDGDRPAFIASLAPLLHYVERANAHATTCQIIVTELRREMTARLADAEAGRLARAEDLLHEARLVFGEAAHRRDRRHRVEAEYVSNAVGRVTAQFLASTTEAQVQELLHEGLGGIGVREASLLTLARDDVVEVPVGLEAIAEGALRAFPGLARELSRRTDRYHLTLVPVVSAGEQLGCGLFDAARLAPLGTIARQLGASLRSARLHAEVLRLSLTDPLTGIRNRAYLDLVLGDEIERSVRYARPMSVLMLDVDRFKSYNDAFGHPAGDAALVAVARAARSVARDADVLARYGGEEFVMVLSETGPEGAHRLAERIRLAVHDIVGLRRPLTVSIGVASLASATPCSESAHALLERADEALYRAKRTGRDRVCVATPP